MSKQYTLDDIPNILNSISWQLKRIADSLENSQDDPLPKSADLKNISSKLRHLIDQTK
jgi:hypothetical protein